MVVLHLPSYAQVEMPCIELCAKETSAAQLLRVCSVAVFVAVVAGGGFRKVLGASFPKRNPGRGAAASFEAILR